MTVNRKIHLRSLLGSASLGVLMLGAFQASAQSIDEVQTAREKRVVLAQAQTDTQSDASFADDETVEQIVVTGSRIRRTEFTSIAPIQVIDVDAARSLGITSFDDILAVGSSVTSGVQFDTNIANNFVTANGPGTSTVNLRGLGADRTLVLINGRRFAPSGVGGAPSNPDTNLIPTLAIKNTEVLLDGAGSVYGSDAVAGVLNIILQDDFEGLMLDGVVNLTEGGGGFNTRAGGIFGVQGERGGFTFSAEYFRNKELRVFDRPNIFTSADDGALCQRDIEINAETGKRADDVCSGTIGAVLVPPILRPGPGIIGFGGGGQFGSFPAIGYREGSSINLFGLEFPNLAFVRTDEDQGFVRHNINNFREEQLIAPLERISTMFNAHYQVNDYAEIYVEANYSNVRSSNDGGKQQIFPTIPGLIPLVDSNGNPIFEVDEDTGELVVDSDGQPIRVLAPNPLNPFGELGLPTTVIQFIDDTGNQTSEREQYRFFTGLRGELGFVPGDTFLNEWTYDVAFGYTRSLGVTSTNVVLEDRLNLGLNSVVVDENGNVSCAPDLTGFTDFFGFIDDFECVPLNLASADLFTKRQLTPEEREFLIGQTSTRTTVDEALVTGFITGDLPIELPGGPIGMALGFEWRENSFFSDGDSVREKGNGAGFFQERDSRGSVRQWELFGEIVVPLLKDKPLVHELTLEAAGRYVNNQFFSSTSVYSVRLGYAPVDWFRLRGNAGTSFRSPNLNFLFLGGQTGFLGGGADPCDTPPADADGNDPRRQVVLDNCVLQGIDPTNFNSPGIEVFSTGAPDLDPEESFSWSVGGSLSQPWFDSFNLQLNATYWEIEVKKGIARPGGGTILAECHNAVNLNSPFCARFTRDPVTRFVTLVDNTPFNLGTENVRGLDLALAFDKGFRLFNRDFTVGANGSVTRLFESSEFTPFETGDITEDNLGDFGFPKWRLTANARIETGPFRLLWNVSWRSTTFSDVESRAIVGADGNFDDDIEESRAIHRISFSYDWESWSFNAGIRNLSDKKPPLVDNSFAFGPNVNFGTGTSDTLLGRTYTFGITKTF